MIKMANVFASSRHSMIRSRSERCSNIMRRTTRWPGTFLQTPWTNRVSPGSEGTGLRTVNRSCRVLRRFSITSAFIDAARTFFGTSRLRPLLS
jgi:hypothetical protein